MSDATSTPAPEHPTDSSDGATTAPPGPPTHTATDTGTDTTADAPATDTLTLSDAEAAVIATEIAVHGEEGPAYGPLSFRIPATGLTVLTGRGGSGRTALALSIAGRMRPSEGELTVLGHTDTAEIRHRVAIAGVEDIDALDRNTRVRDVLTEHRCWSRPWIFPRHKADATYLHSICDELYGDRDVPPLEAYISQLTSLDRILLRIALALHPANGATIEMLVMDDLEQVRELEDRMVLLDLLAHLAETMPVIVNAVNPLPADLAPNHALLEFFTDVSHLHPEHSGLADHRAHSIHSHLSARLAAHRDH